MNYARTAGAVLAIVGVAVEASAHAWSPQDAVWLGFACVLVGCVIIWLDAGARK